jgi:hypothetical protein
MGNIMGRNAGRGRALESSDTPSAPLLYLPWRGAEHPSIHRDRRRGALGMTGVVYVAQLRARTPAEPSGESLDRRAVGRRRAGGDGRWNPQHTEQCHHTCLCGVLKRTRWA